MKFRGRLGRDRNQNLAQADLEHSFRDMDDKFDALDTDAVVSFLKDYTVKPGDRCLVFEGAAAAASLTFPSLTLWGPRRSPLIRVSNRTAFTLTVKYPTSGSFTVAAGANAIMWTDGTAIRNVQ